MHAIKKARRLIETDPTTDSAKTLAKLVLALESETQFDLSSLYDMDIASFELATDILVEWRIDRYYAGKAKLFDLSYQVEQMSLS